MNIDVKKLLLAGTAIVAVSGFAGVANAAAIELDGGAAVVNNVGINDADTIVDAVDDAADDRDIDLDGAALTLGTDAAAAGIDTSGAGVADASTVNFTNTSATAATVTVADDGTNSIDAGAGDLTITLGEDLAGTDALAATNMTVNGIVDGTLGTINFVLDGFNGNTLTFNDTVDLGLGTLVMNGAADDVVIAGTVAQDFTGTIDGGAAGEGNLSVTNTGGLVTFNSDIGNTFALLTYTQAADTNVNTVGVLAAQTITIGADATLDATSAVTGDVVLGAGATLSAGATVTGDVTLGAGSSFETNGDVTGDVNGAGDLTVLASGTFTGSIGGTTALTSITVDVGQVLEVDATAADREVSATTITLTGAASGLTLTPGANDIVVSNDIATGADGTGVIIVTDGAGSVTFEDVGASAAASLASLTTGGGTDQVVNVNGNLFVDAVVLTGEDTLNLLDSSGTVSGTIDGGVAGDGNVVVGNGTDASEYTFAGAIGGTEIDLFHVQTGSTANISQNVETSAAAAAAGIDIDGTLNVDASGNVVSVTTLVGDVDIDGTVDITGDNNVTIGGVNTLIDGTFSSDLGAATLALTGTATVGATSDTTLTLGNLVTNAGTLTLGANGLTTTIEINKTATFDPNGTTLITSAGNVTIAAGSTLNVGLGSNSLGLEDGDTLTVITSAGGTDLGAALTAGDIVLVDSAFVNLEDDTSDATNLNVIAAINAASDVVSSNFVGAADALIDFAAAADELGEARGNLLSASTAEEASNIAESLSPTVDGGAVVGALNVSNRVVGLTSTRLTALRDGDASSGIAAGNMGRGMRGWGQAFGATAEQDHRDGVDGYDADTYGVAVGADGETTTGGHIGVAVSYGNTEVDSDSGFGGETDVDSYQLSLYGDAPLSNAMYVEGMVGYAWNDVETTRFNVGGTGLNSSADYDADQFTVYAEVGRDFVQGGGMTLTPHALAHWTYYNADDYSESGAGAASLQNVDPDSVNIFELGVGVDAAWDMKNRNGSRVKPVLSAGVRYDLVGDEVDTTSSFTGGGAAFETNGMEPGRATLNLGAGVGYFTTDNWELSAEYDYEYKSDYDSHAGQFRAAYHF